MFGARYLVPVTGPDLRKCSTYIINCPTIPQKQLSHGWTFLYVNIFLHQIFTFWFSDKLCSYSRLQDLIIDVCKYRDVSRTYSRGTCCCWNERVHLFLENHGICTKFDRKIYFKKNVKYCNSLQNQLFNKWLTDLLMNINSTVKC